MSLHQFIISIYHHADPLYFVRFIDYQIQKKKDNYILTLNNVLVKPSLTGILVKLKTKTKVRYKSLYEFYTEASGKKIPLHNISFMKEIMIESVTNLWEFLSKLDKYDILEFFDQKYGSLLLFHYIRQNLHSLNLSVNRFIKIMWNDKEYILKRSSIEFQGENKLIHTIDLLDAFHNKTLDGVYYLTNDNCRVIIPQN
jgi:hypothetical protein